MFGYGREKKKFAIKNDLDREWKKVSNVSPFFLEKKQQQKKPAEIYSI